MPDQPNINAAKKLVTACVVLIGDEVLSGRTRDANLGFIAKHLNQTGVQVREARVIPDIEAVIVETINEVRARYDYVFTTGGIGPTHDDITADAIAKAFGVSIDYHPDALVTLEKYYRETGGEFTQARKRMARIPEGALLIANSLSKAPGFQIGNVFVMAGVPMVMQVMMDALSDRLEGGATMMSRTVSAQIGEGTIAEKLGLLQAQFPDVGIGSYPYFRANIFGTSVVMRGIDEALLEQVATATEALIRGFGVEPIGGEPT